MKWFTYLFITWKCVTMGRGTTQRSRFYCSDSSGFVGSCALQSRNTDVSAQGLLPIRLVAVPNNFHNVRFSPLLGIVLGFHRYLCEVWVDAHLCSACATCCSQIYSVKGMFVSMQVLDSGMLYYILLNKKHRRKLRCSHQQLMRLPGLPYY